MKTFTLSLAVVGAISLLAVPTAHADTAGIGLSQTLAAPVSKISFQTAAGADIASPGLAFPLRTARFVCQAGDKAPAAVLGTTDQKLFASVPDRSAAGWDIAVAPTNGVAEGWSGTGGHMMRIDDSSNGGCGYGPDSDSKGGLLAVDTSDMQAQDDCGWGCADPLLLARGASTDFATTPSASLLSSATPHLGWQGTLGGITLRQTIPAGQAADDYQLPMTVTLTEL